MKDLQKDGGIAFGYGDYSLSHEKLKAAAKDIQKNFNEGKTVIKTVISFEEEYLRQNGIIEPDFHLKNAGDYRGNIDQLKLRMAIMNGLSKLSKRYDDLQYIGVIQVDSKHVHCHLAMVDRGRGNLMPDGTQRGKINEKEKRDLRRGIDMFLDETQSVRMMASNFDYEKRNALCFIKRYTHKAMEERGFSQFLLACLPEDRNLWRASTNRKEMQKANSIVRNYVEELLAQDGSGYDNAMDTVSTYARSRASNEGLSRNEYMQLLSNGRKRIIDECMDGVYSVLKHIPDSDMELRTPMLETMSLPYEDMASELVGSDDSMNTMLEFGFKLRSYKSRLDFHKHERHKYHEAVQEYEERQKQGEADDSSRPYYDFLKIEEEYNAMLMAKYQHFLRFIPPDDDYIEDFDKLMAYGERIDRVSKMADDPSFQRMTSDNAERYGQRVYGENGGRNIALHPDFMKNRLTYMHDTYNDMRDSFIMKLNDYGMTLSSDNKVIEDSLYDFDDVKALDLHHLLYDFPYDFRVSTINSDKFVEMADRRYEAFSKAKDYLIRSGQEYAVRALPESDIELQHSTADRFRSDGVLHTLRTVPLKEKQRSASRTVRIDYDFYVRQDEEIKNMIKNTVSGLQYE
jgi:hypothetical protein